MDQTMLAVIIGTVMTILVILALWEGGDGEDGPNMN